MNDKDAPGDAACRYFLTYTGVKVPFNLIGPIGPAALANRNTFIRAYYDADDRLVRFDKVVYGDVELSHRYAYHRDGSLAEAEITMFDEEPIRLNLGMTAAARP